VFTYLLTYDSSSDFLFLLFHLIIICELYQYKYENIKEVIKLSKIYNILSLIYHAQSSK